MTQNVSLPLRRMRLAHRLTGAMAQTASNMPINAMQGFNTNRNYGVIVGKAVNIITAAHEIGHGFGSEVYNWARKLLSSSQTCTPANKRRFNFVRMCFERVTFLLSTTHHGVKMAKTATTSCMPSLPTQQCQTTTSFRIAPSRRYARCLERRRRASQTTLAAACAAI